MSARLSAFASERPGRVGIGLIGRDGMYLIRQRPPGAALPGVWEFPGGKCEPDESPEMAALRECREETGLDVIIVRTRRVVTHRYPHAWVEMTFFDCETADPRAEPGPETGFVWVAADRLSSLTFPGANDAIVAELVEEASRSR